MPIVKKWIARTRRHGTLDWGSRIPLVWECCGSANRFPEYTNHWADRPLQQFSRYVPF
jgi:hypothetical protein